MGRLPVILLVTHRDRVTKASALICSRGRKCSGTKLQVEQHCFQNFQIFSVCPSSSLSLSTTMSSTHPINLFWDHMLPSTVKVYTVLSHSQGVYTTISPLCMALAASIAAMVSSVKQPPSCVSQGALKFGWIQCRHLPTSKKTVVLHS